MRKDSLGIAKQAALGTEQTTMEFFPPVTDVTIAPQRQEMTVEETTGTPLPTGVEYGTYFFNVNAKGAARYASLPRLLSSFLGAPVTTTPDGAGAPTGRQHLFDTAVSPLAHSLLVSRVDPNPVIVDLAWDALGSQLVLDCQPNGFLTYDASWSAISNDNARPAPTVSLDASARIRFSDVAAFINVNAGGEVGFKCAGFTATYNTNLDTDEAILGSSSLYTIADTNKDLEIDFMVRDTLSTHYRRNLLTTAPDQVKIRLTATGQLIGAAVFFKVELIIFACEYIDAPAAVSAASRLKAIPVKARAKLDPVSGKMATLAVVNTTAAY